jgi:hypothetical protein
LQQGNQELSSALLVQSDARFIAVDQTLGLGQRRLAFNRRRCAQDGRVLECARSLRSDFISLTLGKVRTRQFEKNPFLIIVQDSGQTSILDDLDYLDLKDGSSLIPLDSLSPSFCPVAETITLDFPEPFCHDCGHEERLFWQRILSEHAEGQKAISYQFKTIAKLGLVDSSRYDTVLFIVPIEAVNLDSLEKRITIPAAVSNV